MFHNMYSYSSHRARLKQMKRKMIEARREEHKAILPALLTDLPEKAASLTRREWEVLYYVLQDRWRFPHRQDRESVLLVLQVLQHHTDAANLPYPAFWADVITFLWAKEKGAVSEAAAACLPGLQARLNKEKFGSVLLRAVTEGQEQK